MMDKTKMQMGDCSEGCTRHIFFAPCHDPYPACLLARYGLNRKGQAHIIPIFITLAFPARRYVPQIHRDPVVACRAAWLLVFVLSWFQFWHRSVNDPAADSD